MQVEEQTYTVEKFSNDEKATNKPDDNLYPCVIKAIQNIIEEEKLTKYKVKVRALIPDGGNYLANLYEIDIMGETCTEEKKIYLFVKQTISADNLYGFIDVETAYLNEVFFYTDLSVIFEKLQNEANVPSNKRFRNVKCRQESGKDAIIMENLTKKGFKTPHRMCVASLKFARLAVQQMATFHSLSFVIEKRMPEYFEKRIKTLKSILHLNDKHSEVCTKAVKSAVCHYDEEQRMCILKDLPGLIDAYSKYLYEKVSSVNCLCHGDYRMNNLLGREEEGETTEIVPIDFQLLYYGPPVTDLIYFLYTATDTKFRENHEIELKDLYRSTMEDFLRYYDIDMETIFPTEVFERDCKYMKDYGFYLSYVILPICYSDETQVLEPGSDLTKKDFRVDQIFPDRVEGLYEEYKRFKSQILNKD